VVPEETDEAEDEPEADLPLPLALLLEELPLDEELLLPFALDAPPELVDEYKSAYQPPPLRMNPMPSDTCRCALFFLQVGHFLSGGSFMECTASHS